MRGSPAKVVGLSSAKSSKGVRQESPTAFDGFSSEGGEYREEEVTPRHKKRRFHKGKTSKGKEVADE